MKNLFFLALFTLVLGSLSAQERSNNANSPVHRVIFDAGAVPFQYTLSDGGSLKSAGLALGYRVGPRVGLRLGVDFNTFLDQNSLGFYAENEYRKYTALSLGASYRLTDALHCFGTEASLGLLVRLGIDVNKHAEQESVFYDLALRYKLNKLPYVSLGFTHHRFDAGLNNELYGLYLGFGLEF